MNKKSKNIYFTSDTHFGSERALLLSRRPFESTSEMDSTMVSNFNSMCGENDIIIHLGDFGDHNTVSLLKAKIILIMGNYEVQEMKELQLSFTEYRRHLIDVYGYADVLDDTPLLINGQYYLLIHDPKEALEKMDSSDFVLFGHIHGRQMVKKFGLDVGVDAHHFRPIDMKTVEFYKNAIENHYDDSVWC